MSNRKSYPFPKTGLLAALVLLRALSAAGAPPDPDKPIGPPAEPAQPGAPTPPETPAMRPPRSATGKVIQRLVERGLIDPVEAQSLTEQAESEARAAERAEGVRRVPYVPQSVREQLRQQVKAEVLDEVKQNNWAAPNAVPEWTKRIRLEGDFRLRYELDRMAQGNAVDYYPDFNAINTGSPFDVNFRDYSTERWLNTSRRRSRVRLRARAAGEADIGQGFRLELRLGTGDSATPISLNQTLGGSGGNFSKYQFWLDRANLRYEIGTTDRLAALWLGRFENIFLRTDLTWDENVNLDGAALKGSLDAGRGFRPFFAGGAFPIFSTALDFPPELPVKFTSIDKWLYAAQAGTSWKPSPRLAVAVGLGYYHFDRVQGRVSSACDTNIKAISCDTDHSRPSFAQKGNTYRALRTPSLAALEGELLDSNTSRYQYFGLASRFQELVATARIEMLGYSWLKLTVEGEWVRNVGFKRRSVAQDAVNNFQACAADDQGCRANPDYGGGNRGYLARLIFGSPTMSHRWDWSLAIAYRYLQSDAILDAFAQSEFALGGTNNKGFMTSASLVLADNVWATLRWMSSDVITGPPFSIDVLHVDLMARY